MSDCCAPRNGANPCDVAVTTVEARYCPQCDAKGKLVGTETVKALLAVSLEAVRPVGYRFCRTAGCPVVYFSTDGQHVALQPELREPVHQKAPDDDDVFVCYCFRHTPGSIRAELIETGESTVVARVNAGIRAGQCACELRNPQGSCCLGNVRAVLKRVTSEEWAPPGSPV